MCNPATPRAARVSPGWMGLLVRRDEVARRGCRMPRGRKRWLRALPWATSTGTHSHARDTHRYTHAHMKQNTLCHPGRRVEARFQAPFPTIVVLNEAPRAGSKQQTARQRLCFSHSSGQTRIHRYRTQWGTHAPRKAGSGGGEKGKEQSHPPNTAN